MCFQQQSFDPLCRTGEKLVRNLSDKTFKLAVSSMLVNREILKIGLAVTDFGRLLVVRKRGTKTFILPGGKPEVGENDLQTLDREIDEELGCRLSHSSIKFLGEFRDYVAEDSSLMVTVRLYAGEILGVPKPRSEIEKLHWLSVESAFGMNFYALFGIFSLTKSHT